MLNYVQTVITVYRCSTVSNECNLLHNFTTTNVCNYIKKEQGSFAGFFKKVNPKLICPVKAVGFLGFF